MECPTCTYPVLEEWSICRRCGASLPIRLESAKVPTRHALHRHPTAERGGAATTAKAPDRTGSPEAYPAASARAASYFGAAPADRPLAGALPRPDNLLPRATRAAADTSPVLRAPTPSVSTPSGSKGKPLVGARVARERAVRKHWRQLMIAGVVGVALAVGVAALWPVVLGSSGASPLTAASGLPQARAKGLLHTVVGSARELYGSAHSYESLTPASVSARSSKVPVVGAAVLANPGSVSLRVDGADALTLATPADAQQCVFARDDAARNRTSFVVIRTTNCRASAAPGGLDAS